MKKISLFYLLFALISFRSLGAANSAITTFSQLKFWESFILKYKGSLDQKSISLISVKMNEYHDFFILRRCPNSPVCTLNALREKLKNHTIDYVLYVDQEANDYKLRDGNSRLKVTKIDNYFKSGHFRLYIRNAVKKRKGYDLSIDDNNQLEVKSFDILEYNYEGICTLSVIALALVLGTLYSLGFFSSSEIYKEDKVRYIV